MKCTDYRVLTVPLNVIPKLFIVKGNAHSCHAVADVVHGVLCPAKFESCIPELVLSQPIAHSAYRPSVLSWHGDQLP